MMNNKKATVIKCLLRTFVAYAAFSFGWLAFLWFGMSADSAITNANQAATVVSNNSLFAERLIIADIYIFGYSLVYGFSALAFEIKSFIAPAKRTLHIFVNYIAAMVCFYGLHSSAKEVPPKMWITLLFLATVVFFVIYGISALVIHFAKRFSKNK